MYKYKRWITLLIIKKNRDVILKRAKDYYYNNIDTIKKNMRDKYKNLSEEERDKMLSKVIKKIIEKRRKTIFQKKKGRK